MSKVLKASNVIINKENVINVEVMNASEFYYEEEPVIETHKEKITEEEAVSISEQIIEEAKREAQNIINEAVSKAEEVSAEMKNETEAELETIKAEAYNEAYEEGRKQAEAEAKRIISEAEAIKTQALDEKDRILNNAEPEIIKLITDIVEKLISDAIRFNPKLILFLVKQGLSQTTITGEITVHVSQEDYDTVIADKDEILLMAEAGTKIEIIKDISLNSSDCIIETRFGNIDCSLRQQYEALKENLYYICKNRFAEKGGA